MRAWDLAEWQVALLGLDLLQGKERNFIVIEHREQQDCVVRWRVSLSHAAMRTATIGLPDF